MRALFAENKVRFARAEQLCFLLEKTTCDQAGRGRGVINPPTGTEYVKHTTLYRLDAVTSSFFGFYFLLALP